MSTDRGLAALHHLSQHSFSLCLSIRKRFRFFPKFLFPDSLIYLLSKCFFFLFKGSKFMPCGGFWASQVHGRHHQVQNRHSVAPFRSPCLTAKFLEMCAHLWTLCLQFQPSSVTDLFFFALELDLLSMPTYECIHNVYRCPVTRCSKLVFKLQSTISEVHPQIG